MNNAKYMSPEQRRLRHRQEMVDAIVGAARDVIREKGVAALNLSEIARRLGMRTPSLYEYFSGKTALYDHLFRLGTQLFRQRMTAVAAEADLSPWARLERYMTAYLQFAIDNPELFKLVFERHVPGFVPSDESMEEANASLAEASRYLQAFLKAAHITPTSQPDQMRDLFIALMHGIAALHLANNPDQPIGTGRFGSLIPLAIEMVKESWGNMDR